MRDQNLQPVADQFQHQHNNEQVAVVDPCGKLKPAALFLDDWPAPSKCLDEQSQDSVALAEVRKWRLQIMLAVSPYGIPSLAMAETYEKMFGHKFDLKDFKCDSLDELINQMSDIMAVQKPSSTTGILFPEHPHDKVLHDIRLGHDFSQPDYDSTGGTLTSSSLCSVGDDSATTTTTTSSIDGSLARDFNDLIYRAWVDRDEEFPPDVVLVGEPYEQLLKISQANIEGSRGLYQANLISIAGPESLFIRLKTSAENELRIMNLTTEIDAYFKQSPHPIDSYNVPREFISPNFPCLLYSKERNWERCIVVGGSSSSNKILVESIDFGGVYSVNLIYLYLIPKQFLDIPRLTLAVSLAGIKPAKGETKWSDSIGPRLRCFSINDYWVEVLLVEQKKSKIVLQQRHVSNSDTKSSSSSNDSSPNDSLSSVGQTRKKRTVTDRSSYEAIIVDRNVPGMDLYIDEILVMETYADVDPDRKSEIDSLKERLNEQCRRLPRPINKLVPEYL